MKFGVVADDLDRVLVGADRAIRAEAKEHRPYHLIGLDDEARVDLQTAVGHVIDDAHGEVVLGPGLGEFFEHRLDHRRGEFLRRQPVAATDHPGQGRHRQGARVMRFQQGVDHVEIHRLAGGAGFLGAVQHGNGLDAGR